MNREATLKHDYLANECSLVPLGHWKWKWNQTQLNYTTYDREILDWILFGPSYLVLTLLCGSVTESL